jgi:chromosome segregation ATPase
LWVSSKYLDKPTEKALRDALTQRQQLGTIEEKLTRLDEERKKIHAEQKRIRDNLGSLGDRASEKELRERFVRTLSQQEDRLEAIATDETRLQGERDTVRERLNHLIGQLEFDASLPE